MPDNTSSKSPPTSTSTASASPLRQAAFPLAIVMLVGWAVWTFVYDPAPGWVHLFLTLGVFLLIWAIVARDGRATTRRQ
jgi:hypothetical protein